MANKTVDSDLQVNGKVAAGGGESKIEMGYAAEYDEFFLSVPEGGKTLSIGNDAWDDRINLNGSPYAGEYRFDDPELVMSATSGRNDGIEFLVHGSTQRPLIGAGGSVFTISLGNKQLTMMAGEGTVNPGDYLDIRLLKGISDDFVLDGEETVLSCMLGTPLMELGSENRYVFGFRQNSQRLIFSLSPGNASSISKPAFYTDNEATLGTSNYPWIEVHGKKFIIPNGTAAQFLKADGSLDSNAYALHTDLNAVKNNAWKLDIANPECKTVVLTLQQGQGIFEAMAKAGIDYSQSRNIYVDLSEAGEWSGENLFAGYENAPIGVRYHIFFGNVKTAIKLYWASSIESNKLSGGLALTAEYPTAKCEFMRVTDSWTYADWEALIDEVSHVIDTGTASESDNSTLMNYMDNNKINYTKTAKGALVNITALLAALAGNGK
mgnify:CR=1 FL=1